MVNAGYDPTDVAGQDRAKQDTRNFERVEQERWEEDLRGLMQTPQGRRIVWRLLSEAKVYQDIFDESHARMSWHAGRRSLGLFVVDAVNHACPALYELMRQEQKNSGG